MHDATPPSRLFFSSSGPQRGLLSKNVVVCDRKTIFFEVFSATITRISDSRFRQRLPQISKPPDKFSGVLFGGLLAFSFAFVLLLISSAAAQSVANLQGKVVDQTGATVAGATVSAVHVGTKNLRTAQTDGTGFYLFAALPIGVYRIEVNAFGFQTQVVEELNVGIGSSVPLDFQLRVGDISEVVVVSPTGQLIERSTVAVGQVIENRVVQEIPLNGRHLIDLGLLVPGAVTPPQNGNLSVPARALGSSGLNIAGNREDTGNYQINGITLNDQINNIISFTPPIASIEEFRIDYSTNSAENGRNSGPIINIATRKGTDAFHGELFEFVRNDAFDARNFFNFTSSSPAPFKRNQFGVAVGGPIPLPRFLKGDASNIANRTFFFFAYEGLKQRQSVSLNSLVLSDEERAAVSDSVVRRLLPLIPRSNFADSSGTPRFIGSETAAVTVDLWTIDVSHNLTQKDLINGFFAVQRDERGEPVLQGNTIPGFGDIRRGERQILTLNETHVFSPSVVNEVRFGLSRNLVSGVARAQMSSEEFGIRNGVDQPIGLPQIDIAGGLNFGGPSTLPQTRDGRSLVFSDTLSVVRGRHSIRVGGEFRRSISDLSVLDAGTFRFPSIAAFIEGNANAFSISLGDRSSSIKQEAYDVFLQDSFKLRGNLTLAVGMRYSLNTAPSEMSDRFVVFDPASVSLLRVGYDVDKIYKTNALNFQPRLGIVWDPFKDGRTSFRLAYAIMTEQPMINAVQSTVATQPFTTPLSVTGSVRLENAIDLARASGLSPISIDPKYDNSYVQSWNMNVQRELQADVVIMVGYFGSKGTHLRLSRNINQPRDGVRPFLSLSPSSPILPGTTLGNIIQVEGSGNSSYNAVWATVTRRFSNGLQINGSYTWSRSIDYNSLSSPPTSVTVQNSYDVRGDRGPSDFDARHRLAMNMIYELPFRGDRIREGWQIGATVQFQSGNPVNIVTTNSTVTGIANTLRPDVTGPITITGRVDGWFDSTVFTPVPRFGNLPRNSIVGPTFNNVDISVIKNLRLERDRRVQFRFEAFDLLNVANFGQPGRVVGSPGFARITNTRFPTGDAGSSRQLQFAVKFLF